MTQTILKNNILIFIYRLIIILISIIGILAPTQNTFFGQFWFFTLQTNIFVIIMMIILSFSQILKFFGLPISFINKKWFVFLRMSITFFITITGFIYCFLLVPVAIITNSPLISTISYRDIFLHILVPVLSIIEYYAIGQKLHLKISSAFFLLIYPILYVIVVFIRANVSNVPFPGGSKYPYFFIDPTFNNQGWSSVILSIILCLITFYLLGLLYIFINNKLIKNDSK